MSDEQFFSAVRLFVDCVHGTVLCVSWTRTIETKIKTETKTWIMSEPNKN